MSSGFHLTLFDGEDCGGNDPEAYVDSWDDIGIKKTLPVDANDFIISVIPDAGCTCTIKLHHSPDGINWAAVTDKNGNAISFECAGGVCTCKPITVSLLQYVKVEAGDASSIKGVVIKLHYTTF